MSTANENEYTPGFGGRRYKIVRETTSAPAEPVGDPGAPSMGPQRPIHELPDSDSKRHRLLPGFDRVSDALGRGLAIDEAVRRAGVTGHLNIEAVDPVSLDPAKLRGQLGAAVRAGEIDEVTARRLWDDAFPGMRPESLK